MNNIEIKLKLESLEEIENILGLLPKVNHEGILNQTDTYYFCKGSKRLKMREINNIKNELIFYKRENEEYSKLSTYYIFNIPNFCLKVTKFLLKVIFGVKAIVNKKRDLWIYKHTRIHLDKVNNLGNFLELETVLDKSLENPQAEYRDIFEKLSLSKYAAFPYSYSDYAILNKTK